MKPVDLYSKFSRAGLEFEPAFQNVIDGRAAMDNAIGTVSILDTSKWMPREFESRPLIHPATFDACLQVTTIASSRGDFSGSDLHVPTFFKEVTVSHGLMNTPGAELRVFATRHRPFSDFGTDLHESFLVTDAINEDKILIQGRGFVSSPLPPNQSTDGASIGERGLCYQMHLEPCLDLMTREQYADTFTKGSDGSKVTRQVLELERAAFYHLQSVLELISKQHIDIPQTHLRDLNRVVRKLLVQVQQGSRPFQTSDWLSCSGEESNVSSPI